MSFRRLAGISGVIFIALIVVNVVTAGQPPMLDDPVSEITEYYADTHGLNVAAIADQLAGLFAAVFAAGLLYSIWASAAGARRAWAIVGLLGFATIYAVLDTSNVAETALRLSDGGLDEGTTRALYDMSSVAFITSNYNAAVFLLGVGMGVLSTRVLPVWLGWVALVGAALGWLSSFGYADRDSLSSFGGGLSMIAGLLLLVFVLIAGIVMATRPGDDDADEAVAVRAA